MRRLLVAGVALATVAACGTEGATSSGVSLTEFSVSPEATVWKQGEVALNVANEGEYAHTMVLSRADGEVLAATELIAPGESVDLRVDVTPGRYQLTCRIVAEIPTGEIIDHYQEGMVATVEVQA